TFSFYVFIQNLDKLKFTPRVYENVFWFFSYVIIVIIVTYLIIPANFFDTVFHVISAITTTGFSYVDLNNYEEYVYLFFIVMSVGGCLESTAGGIRIDRIVILMKGISLRIKQFINPKNAVTVEKFCNQILNDEIISYSGLILFSYILLAIILASMINYEVGDFKKSFFTIISSLSNVGLELGIVRELSTFSKILILLSMFIGRLEIVIPLAFIPALLKLKK
ncbi:MAG: potassium transporter TrkG, partial [Candidatus Aenigmarchaeota archaeon]|nr:hypothetical protein [Candidatus Aenigmarchaeota archaeon]MDW8149029.1 potassium transporter TrkG [Candidatus Aenigmarchaeota archaeon]